MERNIQYGKDFSITNERCITVQSRYEYEIKNKTLLAEEKACNVCCILNAFLKKQWKIITGKSIKRIKCKLGCSERREEMFKYHIKLHNIYSTNEYYMKPETLEDLLTTEHCDVILVTLIYYLYI